MTASQFKEKYNGMSSRDVRELISSSADFKRGIAAIYTEQMHQTMNHNCNDCYMDAYIVIMTTPIEKINAMSERQFELRAGAVLYDVVAGDRSKLCNANTLTDELALYHLATNPEYIGLFRLYPENWQELAVKSVTKAAETAQTTEAVQTTTEAKKVAKNGSKRAKSKSK